MVDRVEGRSREGLKQLAAFRTLPSDSERQDDVLSAALGRAVRGATITDVLLCRSGIGTHKVWADLANVIPLNLTLLQAVVDDFAKRNQSLADFGLVARRLFDEVCGAVIRRWTPTAVSVGNVTMTVPLLELDNAKLQDYRLRWNPR
jgi:hypothetical protein